MAEVPRGVEAALSRGQAPVQSKGGGQSQHPELRAAQVGVHLLLPTGLSLAASVAPLSPNGERPEAHSGRSGVLASGRSPVVPCAPKAPPGGSDMPARGVLKGSVAGAGGLSPWPCGSSLGDLGVGEAENQEAVVAARKGCSSQVG